MSPSSSVHLSRVLCYLRCISSPQCRPFWLSFRATCLCLYWRYVFIALIYYLLRAFLCLFLCTLMFISFSVFSTSSFLFFASSSFLFSFCSSSCSFLSSSWCWKEERAMSSDHLSSGDHMQQLTTAADQPPVDCGSVPGKTGERTDQLCLCWWLLLDHHNRMTTTTTMMITTFEVGRNLDQMDQSDQAKNMLIMPPSSSRAMAAVRDTIIEGHFQCSMYYSTFSVICTHFRLSLKEIWTMTDRSENVIGMIQWASFWTQTKRFKRKQWRLYIRTPIEFVAVPGDPYKF